MESHNSNNTGKPVPKSNKAISPQNNRNSVPAKTNNSRSVVSQSVGMRNVIPNTGLKPAEKPLVKKKNGSVVGLNNHNKSSLRAVRNPNIITVRKKERTPFPIAIVFSSLILTALLLFLMMNYAEINKYNSDNTELATTITELQDDLQDLNVKLDKKINLVDIEKDAIEKLGMVKIETLEHHRVTLPSVDRSEIIKYEDGEEGGLGFLLTGVGEVIRDFMEEE